MAAHPTEFSFATAGADNIKKWGTLVNGHNADLEFIQPMAMS